MVGWMGQDMIDTMVSVFYFISILRCGDGHGGSALSISLVRDYFMNFFTFAFLFNMLPQYQCLRRHNVDRCGCA